ncbi:MAG: DNA polymerase III subunit alpha [Ruminococcus flavefaciens]|nr:DNA polymerase III subunit alpha [Ruminococcus flavefaciens]
MKNDSFVNLHVHTEYSLLDGACRIKKLIERVKELGQPAVAITDHGTMYGAVEFWSEAKKAGVKAVIGCEVYVAPRKHTDKEGRIDLSPYHLVLLCENNEGYRNLVKLVSIASIDGFYNRPRVDADLLRKYHAGLICLSGCLYGEISRLIVSGNYTGAKSKALEYRDIFGEGNYYIEVQNHGTLDELRVLPMLYRLSEETGIPLVATNDCHYVRREDSEMHKVLWCIQTNQRFDETENIGGESYVKSADEMTQLFKGHEEAVTNTVRIAERCNVEFEFGNIKLPEFRADGITDNKSYLRELCYSGLKRRYGDSPPEEVADRMEYELSVIIKMGYTDYFLIVWDFVRYARENKIPVGVGRGSGAGSLCAYCMGITSIDPIKYGLLFERFLNPERVSMPDFDIDFCIEGRPKVKEYVFNKYGRDKVSEIIAFDTFKARGAVRDVGRVLGMPNKLCDTVAKKIDMGSTLGEAVENSPELRTMYNTDSNVKRIIDLAFKIEGMPRHASTHAAGVVISAVPLSDLVPLQKNDNTIVTQYTMTVLESLGLLKMDFLGLRNLTIIRDTVNAIKRTEPDFDIEKISVDDKDVYAMLSAGDTGGVFQFESEGITKCLTELQPERIEDLIVMLSLYRPGPMKSIPEYIRNKNNPEMVRYKHPLLESILSETYGCIIYQEQVMEICRKLAGYSYGHADVVRRAMAKKKHDVMLKERESFVAGAEKNGVPEKTANEIFDEMISFASYAFNKSHAGAYAFISYQTAYLKYHYRGIYMSALMSSVTANAEKLSEYIGMCRTVNIEVVRPDINMSMKKFSYRDGKIYFGLMAVKNVGEGLAERIVAERTMGGSFRSLQDFIERMDRRDLIKKAVEYLIMSGAFDGLGLNRRQMIENYSMILEKSGSDSGVIEGQLNFLDSMDTHEMNIKIPYIAEYPLRKILSMEKESAGIYFSGNPLSEYWYLPELLHTAKIKECSGKDDGCNVNVFCMVQSIKPHVTKKGDRMCFIEFSDGTGTIDGVIFPELYKSVSGSLDEGSIILVNGTVSAKESGVSLICNGLTCERNFSAMAEKMKLCIKINSGELGKDNALAHLCERFSGKTQIVFYLTDVKKMISPKKKMFMNICSESVKEIRKNYGESSLGLIR